MHKYPNLVCLPYIVYTFLSHAVASESDITPCNKIDKQPVVYRFTGNAMTLRKLREPFDVFTPRMQILSIFNVM